MRTIIILFSILLSSPSLFAGTTEFGPYSKYYKITGCGSIYNFTNNMDGYTTSGSNFDWDGESLRICDKNTYMAENPSENSTDNYLSLLSQIAEKARAANCFKTTIDHSKKTIVFELLSANKRITEIRESRETYILEGYKPLVEYLEIREKITNICILEPSAAEFPYTKIVHR